MAFRGRWANNKSMFTSQKSKVMIGTIAVSTLRMFVTSGWLSKVAFNESKNSVLVQWFGATHTLSMSAPGSCTPNR